MLYRKVKIKDQKSLNKHCIINTNEDTYIDAGSFGEVKKTYHQILKKHIAVKTLPLNINDIAFIDVPFGDKSLHYSTTFSEILFYRLLNLLIYNKVIPNFPIMYNWYYCNHCPIKSKSLQDNINRTTTECLYMEQELADGTLYDFIKKYSKKLPEQYWYTIFFQIFVGIYTLRKYFNITHNDLHYNNVLFIKLPKDSGYIKYILHDRTYYVANFGYLFLIADFGLATIEGKVMTQSKYKNKHYLDDFYEILDIHSSYSSGIFGNLFTKKRETPLKTAVRNLRNRIKYSKSELEAVERVGDDLFNIPTKNIIGTINLNKKLKVPKVDEDLKKFII